MVPTTTTTTIHKVQSSDFDSRKQDTAVTLMDVAGHAQRREKERVMGESVPFSPRSSLSQRESETTDALRTSRNPSCYVLLSTIGLGIETFNPRSLSSSSLSGQEHTSTTSTAMAATRAATKAVEDAMERGILRYNHTHRNDLQLRLRLGVPEQCPGDNTPLPVDVGKLINLLPGVFPVVQVEVVVGGLFVPPSGRTEENEICPSICTVVACLTLQQSAHAMHLQSLTEGNRTTGLATQANINNHVTGTSSSAEPTIAAPRTWAEVERLSAESSKVAQGHTKRKQREQQQHQQRSPPPMPYAAATGAANLLASTISMLEADTRPNTTFSTTASSDDLSHGFHRSTSIEMLARVSAEIHEQQPSQIGLPQVSVSSAGSSTAAGAGGQSSASSPSQVKRRRYTQQQQQQRQQQQQSQYGMARKDDASTNDECDDSNDSKACGEGSQSTSGTAVGNNASTGSLQGSSLGNNGPSTGNNYGNNYNYKKLPPGVTPKNNKRLFVRHNYRDHSGEVPRNDELDLLGPNAPLRTTNAAFPLKLHEILTQIEMDGHGDIIGWLQHGRSFKIHKQKEFVETILPRYFVMTKKSSFLRQLNLYGFNRLSGVGPNQGSYYHEKFLRGMKFLARRMQRQKVNGNGIRAAGNPDEEPNLSKYPPCPPASGILMDDHLVIHKEEEAVSPIHSNRGSPTHQDHELYQQQSPSAQQVQHALMMESSSASQSGPPVLQNDPLLRGGAPGTQVSFPLKLQRILDKLESEGRTDVVSWLPHGRAFLVHDVERFVNELMPLHFNQTKYSSFQRQLHMYNFQRITAGYDKGAYHHPHFQRGHPELSCKMQRTRVNGKGTRRPGNPEEEPNLHALEPLPPIRRGTVIEIPQQENTQFHNEDDDASKSGEE